MAYPIINNCVEGEKMLKSAASSRGVIVKIKRKHRQDRSLCPRAREVELIFEFRVLTPRIRTLYYGRCNMLILEGNCRVIGPKLHAGRVEGSKSEQGKWTPVLNIWRSRWLASGLTFEVSIGWLACEPCLKRETVASRTGWNQFHWHRPISGGIGESDGDERKLRQIFPNIDSKYGGQVKLKLLK